MAEKRGKLREKLEAEGWVRQFIACEPRLSEAVELYKSLGFEVRLVRVTRDELEGECAACFEAEDAERYKVIYTRGSARKRK
jgi:hypothetical protein